MHVFLLWTFDHCLIKIEIVLPYHVLRQHIPLHVLRQHIPLHVLRQRDPLHVLRRVTPPRLVLIRQYISINM